MSSRTMIRALVLALGLQTLPATADTTQAMRTALELAAGKDFDGALAVAPSGVGRDVIEWQRLRAGGGRLGDYEAFLQRRPDWPGLPLLREKGEEAVARSTDPARIIAWFEVGLPVTGRGAIAYVRALQAQGRAAEAETEAMRAWSRLAFSPEQEAEMIGLAPEAVGFVHELRLDTLLWEGRTKEATRMLSRVPEDLQALARARIALQEQGKGVTGLIEAVPKRRAGDPGLAYDRFIWRMKKDLYDEATELILERSKSAESLGRPQAWAERRALLARWLMRQGRAKEAYRVAANHHLPTDSGASAYADLEFLAGFIALRRLNDPATAERHFQHLLAGVSTPISVARAHYWIGRAEEAAGRDGSASYRAAARHQTAFYGLLAAERLGLSLDAGLLARPATPDWRSAGFTRSSVLAAAELLRKAGDRSLARRFLLHLGESQDATGLAQMADMALAWGDPNMALLIAKQAAERGLILPHAYYPIPDFVPDGLKVSRALALSIARRESEFDPTARSSADARGLMQVLPGTARLMAGKLGKEFDAGKLTSDPAYNVTMGSAYLAEMAAEFGPSIALIASGYNAGPGRPRRWITEFGDPRRPDVDVVDWVETIPFAETRTYVMRVAEGVVIYRAKLKGAVGPVRITSELKG
ncbi:lytic transglycosylase domain-containing protein [Rhodobacter calidifons]|uniref:Lytic transglycosylase domain-containing protein n=1 Tax=Rhodobacter calidifons TaxID=2715277 RepID=A0ABX0G604_9RHOB|nr:lytic transglycosylase domain-containing protein [Rhodobacter calidifons]NHB76320.1 lytic transglycosylase domain-containing protein [Rhodobacter calidifons]